MKAILKYNLPEDEEDFKRATKSLDMALALFDIGQELRSIDKYRDDDYSIEEIRDKFYTILNNYNIDLDDILS